MANTKQFKLDATAPFYAAVGVADLTVSLARTAATDVQARFAKVDLEPKTLRDQTTTLVEARVSDLQADARALPAKVESYVNEAAAGVTETYGELAARGKHLVGRIRGQQATQDAKSAGKSAVTQAKSARTQATKSAKSTTATAKKSAGSTGTAAKKTGATAKRNAKATTTGAKKTATATTKAASDAGQKVGN